MATLEEQRRASGARMEAERRAIGARLETERRAIGTRMEAERRGEDIADDMQRLYRPTPPRRSLPSVPPLGALPPARGRGIYDPVAAGHSGGGGIASPLTEKSREYHESKLVTTFDGLAFFQVRRVKRLTMTDASGADVVMEFADVP